MITENIIEEHDEVEYTESDDEWWDNLPHDSEAEDFTDLELGEDGYYHHI